MKRALIYDPYLNTLGGGERYSLSFGLGLAQTGYEVDVAWDDETILKKAEERFGLDFSSLGISKKAFDIFKQASLWQKFLYTKNYDLIFWVSDGSLPFLFSSKNMVHFQMPFKKLGGTKLVNSLKSFFINKFVYNSYFTQAVLEKNLPKSKSFVLHPPVDISSFSSLKKEDLILSVARFDSPSHSKRQDVLIDAFREFSLTHPSYSLILAGGVMGESVRLSELKRQAGGLPVIFLTNPSFDTLKNIYAKSKFFWHAAGFQVNETENPDQVEHFGMTTVEAISAGCIPLVINRGGQSEILENFPFLLCEEKSDFNKKTSEIIERDKFYTTLSLNLKNSSKVFALDKFYEKVVYIAK